MIIRDDTQSPPAAENSVQHTGTSEAVHTAPADKDDLILSQPTGTLRPDLEIFDGGNDESGSGTRVIFDPVAGSYFRIAELDARIISCMSGDMAVRDFLKKIENNGIPASRDKVLKTLSFLRASNLLTPVYKMTESTVNKSVEAKRKMFFHIILSSYLFFRIPLFSPDRFLLNTIDIVQLIFNKWTLAALKLLTVAGYLCLLVNWSKFADAFIASISMQGLIHYSIAITLIKVVHEFSHAYVARSYGCRVRKMGIALIFFLPRLYSDLTDSWRLKDTYKRFIMDGAGIFSEIIIGGIAALIWANTGSGITHTVAYYIFAVSIMNTFLVNGNPFIRYDGYYMLMDILNIDNLNKRGVEVVRNIWRQHLFGMAVQDDPSRGWKRAALIAYGISSFLYRIFLYMSIILLVYFNFAKAVGIVLLVLEVYLLIITPFVNEVKFLVVNYKRLNQRKTYISLAGLFFIILLLIIPLPWRIVAPCEIKPAESAVIYAPAPGYIRSLPPADGESVSSGQELFVQDNPLISFTRNEAELDVKIDALNLDNAQRSGSVEDRSDVSVLEETLQRSRDRLSEAERQIAMLSTRSPVKGTFILQDRLITPGKWLNRGDMVGEVFSPGSQKAVAYVPEEELKYIKVGDRVSVALNGQVGTYRGRITNINPQSANPDPSPLLSIFGGQILGYMGQDNLFVPLSAYYRIDISFDGEQPPPGRSGDARLYKYASVGGNMLRTVIRVLRTELSF